jgi:hypothetical protein
MSVGGDRNYSDPNQNYGDKIIKIHEGKTGGTSKNKKKQAQEQTDREVKTSQRQTKSQIKKGTDQTQTGQQTTKTRGQNKQQGTSATRTATKPEIGKFGKSTLGKAKGQAKITGQQIKLGSPGLAKPTTDEQVSGEKILQAMSQKGQQTNHVGKAQEQILKATKNQIGPDDKIPKGQQGKLLETVMQSTLKNLQESANPPKDAKGTFNEAFGNLKDDRQGRTNLNFNSNIDKNIQKQPKETQQKLNLMRSNPEFSKFQSSGDVKTFNQVLSQAKQESTPAAGSYLKSNTQQTDDEGTSKMIKGDQFLTKKLMKNDISQSDFGKLNRARSGEIPENQLKGTAKNGEDLKQVFQDLKKATESPDKTFEGLQNMTPKGKDQDETRVKSALKFLQGAMTQLKDKSPNLTKKDVLEFIMKRGMKGLSPKDRQNLENTLGNQFEKNGTSILSLKKMMTFDEGWQKELNKLVDNKTLTKSEAEIFNNPGSVMAKEKEFTSKLKENMTSISEQLIKAGMKKVKNSFRDHLKARNKTNNHVSFLNQLKANGATASQINEFMKLIQQGKTPKQAIDEIKRRTNGKQFGKSASLSQKKVSVDGGFLDGESFEIDGITLQSIAKTIEAPRMNLKMQALSFMNEQQAAALSLLGDDPEAIEAIRSQLPTTFPGEPVSEKKKTTPSKAEVSEVKTNTEPESPPSVFGGFQMSIGAYVSQIGAFNNDVTNMFTQAQISDSQSQTKITIMKNIANQVMTTKAFNAMQEQKDQKDKGPVGNFFADLFGAITLVVAIVVLTTIATAFTAIGLGPVGYVIASAGISALATGVVKNFQEGGINQALQAGVFDTFSTGLKVWHVPDVVADALAFVFAVYTVVVVAVAAAALAIITGGLATWAIVLLVMGTVSMIVAGLASTTGEFVGALAEDGAIDEDTAKEIQKNCGYVSLAFSIAGMALAIPSLIVAAPEMAKSVANLGKSIYGTIRKVGTASMEFASDFATVGRGARTATNIEEMFIVTEDLASTVDTTTDVLNTATALKKPGAGKTVRLADELDDATLVASKESTLAKNEPAPKKGTGDPVGESQGAGEGSGKGGKNPTDPEPPVTTTPGAPPNTSVPDAQMNAQAMNETALETAKESAQKAKLKQLEKVGKNAAKESDEIAAAMDRGNPKANFEKAYKDKNFDEMAENWGKMDGKSRAAFRDGLDENQLKSFNKDYLERLNYETLSDASKAKVNDFFGQKDVGARIKSDLDKEAFIKKLRLGMEGIDVVKKGYDFIQKLDLGYIKIFNAKHQEYAQILEAEAKRAKSSVETMDQAMDSIIQDMQGLTSLKKSSAKQTDAFFKGLSNITTEIAYALTPKA